MFTHKGDKAPLSIDTFYNAFIRIQGSILVTVTKESGYFDFTPHEQFGLGNILSTYISPNIIIKYSI